MKRMNQFCNAFKPAFLMKFLFIFSAFLFSFNIHLLADSERVHSIKNFNEVDSVIAVGKKFLDLEKYELAIKNYELSLKLSEKYRYESGVGKSEMGLGAGYRLQGNNPSALEAYYRALEVFHENSDSVSIADCYNALGLIHSNKAEFSLALDYFFKALGIYNRHKILPEESNALLNIGRLYSQIEDLDKALEFTNKALVNKRKIDDQGGIANSLNNLGIIYRRRGELDKAHAMFEESLSIQRKLKDQTGIANSLNNIGILLHSRDQSAKAIEYFREALKIREELGDKSGIAMGLYNLGFMYSVIDNDRKALEYFQKSIAYSLQIKDNNFRLRGYEAISEQYEKTGDFENSLVYNKKFHQLHDSLFNENSKNQLSEIQQKYEANQKEIELAKTRQVSLALGGLLIMSLALVIVIFFAYRKIKRINSKLNKRNREIKRQTKRAEEVSKELQQNLKLKELFFAAANHELRVPLSIILGFTDLLESKINDKNQLQFIEQIKSNSKSLQKLVDDILDFSSIESGKFRLEKEPVNILKLARDIHDIFYPKFDKKPIQFIVYQDSSMDFWLMIDELRVRQILYNLMENAMKFTGEGKINLKLEINQENAANSYALKITIQDSGIGIPEECQQLVFNSNYSTRPLTEAHRIGYGLGLQIIRKLVDCMNGSLILESNSQSGTRFEITLPGLEQYTENVKTGLKENLVQDEDGVKTPCILIVDDSELNRRLLSMLLKEYHYEPAEAEDGKEALEMIVKKVPEMILMDLYMPNMDGYSALKKLKENKATASIPVIAVTASASEEERNHVMDAGFDAYITKPVNKELLLKEIGKFLRRKKPVSL
jgi:signal transduction histidine kinase/ActR/RegA family two-component response regulator